MRNCNCTYRDLCNCLSPEDCIISSIIANDEADLDEEIYDESEKDRKTARKRHHNDVKAKERSLKSANILCSKADRLPAKSSTREDFHKANVRACNAIRRSDRFKKQNMAQEEKEKPYRRFQ